MNNLIWLYLKIFNIFVKNKNEKKTSVMKNIRDGENAIAQTGVRTQNQG
jgi:hypothetical protein